jgi:ADP-ribosylglycohydrolase
MSKISLSEDYHDRVYAGWLGKCIGVHFGGPLESWTYQDISTNLGEVTDYLQPEGEVFKPDDDLVMPLVMMNALNNSSSPEELTAEAIGRTWLNLLGIERGAIWRGGYGVSSEHTAFLNLINGIPAPQSGSAALNGKIISEQIGGQIFSDIWGLVSPNAPETAADLSEKAASISHDGEGINGGRFVAALVSAAFSENDPFKLIEAGLKTIPHESDYAQVCRDMVRFHKEHPGNWHAARQYIDENWGYDRYEGVVPIIPNAAIIVISLLYGEGDFSRSIQIAIIDEHKNNLCKKAGTIFHCRGQVYARQRTEKLQLFHQLHQQFLHTKDPAKKRNGAQKARSAS